MAVQVGQSTYESSKFYINRVLTERIEANTAWVKKFDDLQKSLVEYITENYKMGVDWNPRGADFAPSFNEEAKEPQPAQPAKSNVTPQAPVSKPTAPSAPAAQVGQTRERGNDLIFENYKGRKDLVVLERDCVISRGILLDNLVDCVVQVQSKVKNIVVTGCSKTGVVLTEVISGVEIINSKKIQVQSQGKVPTISIDSTEGVEVFLGGDAKDHIVFAVSKSADMNVTVEDETNPEGWTELAIPHQHIHRIVGGQVTSEVSELYR